MARTGARLPFVSNSGPDPEISITPEQWQQLFELYGHQPGKEAFDSLVFLCNEYLHWRRAELSGRSWRDAEKLFAPVEKAVEQFLLLSDGALFPHGDAGSAFENLFASALESTPCAVTASYVQKANPDLEGGPGFEEIPNDGFAFKLTLHQLSFIGFHLAHAVRQVRKELDQLLADNKGGIQPGEAFDLWLLGLHQWAKENRFKCSAFAAGGTESKFSTFLFELNRLFPPYLRDPVASPIALGQRIKLVRKRAK